MRVYLDHNATAPLAPAAREALARAAEAWGNPSSLHAEGRRARALLEDARERLAAFAACKPSEVVLEYETLVGGNVIFQERTKGIGVLGAELARSLGCTGPTLRASGGSYDVRKTRPYGIYPQLSFQVPVATAGDSWARYLVRIAEMRESLGVVRQALDAMPEGPVRAKLPVIVKVPKGRWLSRVEAARGEIAFYLEGDGGEKPWRVKVRSPNFSNLAAVPEISKGRRVADIVAILSTLDVVIPCIDR